jgi:ATP-dependent DNA helicase RecQ
LEDSGTTLVISPLIALMKDQLDKLPVEATRLATTINSSLEGQELRRRLNRVRAGHYRLVYAAPERLRQAPFVHALRQAGLNRLVIDEVHCVSMWGHDFRPDYLYIDEARRLLGDPPLLAFTATAPPRVQLDILQRLSDMRVLAGDVMRSNLRLEVFRARSYDDKLQYLLGFCRNEPGAGIIYARTRKRCETLAELLRSQGVSAIHYHAGIDNRAAAQDEFMSNGARVVVATIAFGMGIDKPDIRFILHVGPPASLEYSPSDRALLSRHARQDALSNDFLEGVYRAVKVRLGSMSLGRIAVDDLRRDLQVEETPVRVGISILEQAGMLRRWQDIPRTVTLRLKAAVPSEQPELAAFCGVARLQPGQSLDRDLVAIAQQADMDLRHLECQVLGWAEAGWLECRFSGRDPLLELLSPTADTRQRLDSLLDQYDKVQGQRVAEIVGYATTRRCRHGHISAYLGGRTIARCTACDNCLGSSPTTSAAKETRRRGGHPGRGEERAMAPRDVSIVRDDDPLFRRLRAWRLDKAREERVPAFRVAHNSVLRSIAAGRPRTERELRAIRGIGPRKLEKYGAELLSLVREGAERTS